MGGALALLLTVAASPAALELESLAGDPVAVAPRGGRPLVLHFFATWCPSCAEELPVLARARSECDGAVDIQLVDVEDDPGELRRYLAAHGLQELAPSTLRDPKGRAWRRATGGRGLPANLIWDGDERRNEVGPRSSAMWRELLADLGCLGPPAPP